MKKLITVSSDCSGVGAVDQSLIRLGIEYEKSSVCDFNKYARRTYILNYGTDEDFALLEHPDVKFIDSIYDREFGTSKIKPTREEWIRVDEIHERTARLFSFYYPWDMYKREIPADPVDLYVATVPCQAFSLAGKRKGEEDRRGVLIYSACEFVFKNKPKYFIFENVKGLLSDDGGKTFQRWIDLLGGKSVNGNPVIFPHEDSVPYNVYYQVINAKHYGVPQNRERIFIIGIREDKEFNFPKPFELKKRLRDVLESDVDEKYFLSDKMVRGFITRSKNHKENGNGFKFETIDPDGVAKTITDPGKTRTDDNFLKVKSANSKGYEIAEIGEDSINFEHPNSETRRGRVGKGVAQTLTTSCNQGIHNGERIRKLTPRECFRLMDFPDTFKWDVSDSQAYKQAGNSICVEPLKLLIENILKL